MFIYPDLNTIFLFFFSFFLLFSFFFFFSFSFQAIYFYTAKSTVFKVWAILDVREDKRLLKIGDGRLGDSLKWVLQNFEFLNGWSFLIKF